MEFDFGFGRPPAPKRDEGAPMRLLVLGDFSGRPPAERPPLAGRPTHRVDIDNLDSVMARLKPQLALEVGNLEFEQLDDLHPDALYNRLPLFDALRQARANPPKAGSDDLLSQLLGGQPAAASSAAPALTGIDALIRNIVAPHIVRDESATLQPYLAAVDSATAEQMRKLLHAAAFQSLEGAWRGVQWLIQSLELDDVLQLHIFDVGRDELLADIVAAQGQLANTGLYRALADRWRNVPGGQGWTLLTGLYRFGPSETDVGLLAALGILASQAGGPFVAAGDPALAADDAAKLAGWNALRASEAAPWIGLAAPRVLLRLPYGKRTDPIASFAFEEFQGLPTHDDYLWGAGSLAIALLIGRAFSARGWDFEPGDEREIGDLPAYSFEQDGERELQACAESYLGETAGQMLLNAGLMPVLSHRHANAVTVMRFQSIAAQARTLAGLGAGR
jgi:type VI secretion system protein ImpC